MKRVIYITAAVFALGLASCAKQDVQPTNDADTVVPVWKAIGDNNNEPDPTTGNEGGGGIVDPETDPEIETSGT